MTKNANNKKIIIGISIIVIVFTLLAFSISRNGTISDNFFKSDNNKYVITLENDETNEPIKKYSIYYYKDNTITKNTIYNEYSNATIAKEYYESNKNKQEPGIKKISLNDKYIIVELEEEQFKNQSLENIKNLAEETNN